MKSKLIKPNGWLLAIVVVAGLLALLGSGITGDRVARADSPPTDVASWSINAKNENPGVLPPNSNPFGKSYGEWSAAWWQWAYSVPAEDNHPLIADGVMDCSLGQKGKVWFLGGTFTTGPDPDSDAPIAVVGKADRECTVPTGKALFFPILNAEADDLGQEPRPEEELRDEVKFLIDAIDPNDLAATLDGVEIGNLQAYRTDSPSFTLGPLPDPNLPGKNPGATSPAVADGYYLMLAPLSAGVHEITFEGLVVIPDGAGPGQDFSFRLDIRYVLTVQ